TLIFASMVLVWLLLFFPHKDADGTSYFEVGGCFQEIIDNAKDELAELKAKDEKTEEDKATEAALKASIAENEKKRNAIDAEWKRKSYLGQLGHAIEPAVKPL